MTTPSGAQNTASPTATTTSATASSAPPATKSVQERFSELTAANTKAAQRSEPRPTTKPTDVDDENTEVEAREGENEGEEAAEKQAKPDEKKKEEYGERVKRRIDQLTAQRRQAEAKVADSDLARAKAEKAFELVSRENDRLRETLMKAGLLDERDDKIAQYRLVDEARKLGQGLDQAHKKRLTEEQSTQSRSALREQLAEELETVLAPYAGDDVAAQHMRSLVINAAKADPSKSLSQHAAEIEQWLGARRGTSDQNDDENVDSEVETAPPAPQRRMPKTVRARPGGATRTIHPPTLDGVRARYAELQATRRE